MNALTPVPFNQVTFDDAFWAPRIKTNRTATLPAVYEMLARTGRIAAWAGAWRPGDPNPPHAFWDSEIAKWMEAASYSLATHYDAELDAQLDALIARLARLQLPDGYVNSHYILIEPDQRWTNLRDKHELYCAGHLIEAAVAHQQATGKRAFLDIVRRYADHIDATFGRAAGKRRGYCGHEEIELALVKLYCATGEARYLRLAQYFVDERGREPHYFDLEARERGEDPRNFWAKTYAYMQAHLPVRAQREVVGHAVRAMYLYSAMADLARETDDAELLAVCERLWHSACEQQTYLTGGIGQTGSIEGFTGAYDLPDETACAETCAAIGLVMWNHRMLQLTGEGRYADVMERALYNGVLSGVSLDGTKFFYENPLASRGDHHRQAWFDCACCPPNLARLLASIGNYFYSTDENDVWVHLYAQNEAKLGFGSWELGVRLSGCYPWDGAVNIELRLDAPRTFTLHLRVPSWCERWRMAVNSEQLAMNGEQSTVMGYLHLTREWSPGDIVTLNLAMPVRYVYAHPAVPQMVGRVALQRGSIVYCLEGVDHAHIPLDYIAVNATVPAYRNVRAAHEPDLLGGVTVLRGRGFALDDGNGALYRFFPPETKPIDIMAVPYCAWDNRAPGEMRVWVRQQT